MKLEIDWKIILIIFGCFIFIYQEKLIDVYMYSQGIHNKYTNPYSFRQHNSYNTHVPTVLIKQNGLLYLHKVYEPNVPGVNPLIFQSYNDYINYCNFKQSQGVYTPILQQMQVSNQPFLTNNIQQPQSTNDINISEVEPEAEPEADPEFDSEPEPQSTPQKNQKSFTDESGQSISAMDTNWGGIEFSQAGVLASYI